MKPKRITIHAGENWQSQHKYALGVLLCLDQSKSWDVSVQRHVKRRSYPQLKALYGIAYRILSEETGHEPDDLHDYFLGEFTGWKEAEVFGRKEILPMRRTSDMDVHEMADFYAFVQRRAAEKGYYIPDPNEY